MNDHARLISLALHEIKRNIHEVAVHSRAQKVDPYVSLKAVDAIIDRNIMTRRLLRNPIRGLEM